jgi:non-ribosomal peptide synthetase component F/thioesterase domain-containing protein
MRARSENLVGQHGFTTIVDTNLPEPGDAQVCVFPASLEQSRYWVLDQLDGASSASNMAIAFRLEGAIDDAVVEQSLRELVRRHEALRTNFRMVDGELSQIVSDEPRFSFAISDLRSLDENEAAKRAHALKLEHGRVHIDLAHGPMFFAHLIHLTESDHVLAFTIHHIACDGWSNGILVRDFASIYAAESESRAISLPELPFQFADFTVWQQKWLESEEANAALAFWREHIRRDIPAVDLPTDRPRSAQKSAPGHIESQLLSPSLTAKLKTYSRQHDATMHQILLAAFEGLVSRYTDQAEFLLGSTIANRTQPGMEHVVGRFANPQVILADVQGDPTYSELVQRVADWSAKSYAHQDLPFSRLMEEFQLDQSGATSQFLQIYFVYQKAFMQPQHAGTLKVIPQPSVSGGVNFDLLVSVVERSEGPRLQIEYNTLLFERQRIRRLIEMYIRVLEAAMDRPGIRVSELPLLSPEEKAALDMAGGETTLVDLGASSIPSWLSEQAAERGESTAIVAEGQRISWRALESKSREFAAGLLELGVRAQDSVAIRMAPSVEAAACVLAVLRIGAVVLPIPPSTSATEYNLMLLSLEPKLALAEEAFAEKLNRLTSFAQLGQITSKDRGSERLELDPIDSSIGAWRSVRTDPGGHCRVTVTSHQATLRAMLGAARVLDLRAGDGVLVWPAQAGNDSLTDLLLPLLAGACVIHAEGATPNSLQRMLDDEQATFAFATVAEFTSLLENGWKGDRRVRLICRGAGTVSANLERLAQRFARSSGGHSGRIDWLPSSTAGPFAVARVRDRSLSAPDRSPAASVCQLAPIAGQRLMVLDRKGNPVPYGVVGELTIEEVIHQLGAAPRVGTGYLARYSPDRGFEIVDSRDRQVRLHGYRLRLADVENALYRNPEISVAEATVLRSGGAPALVAYIVGKNDQLASIEQASSFLKQIAPSHISSAELVSVLAIRRREDGSPNFSAMPKPGGSRSAASTIAFVPPRDELESKLVKIWEEVLGIKGIGIRTSFFSLGGYSLTIVRLFAQVNKTLGSALPITTIFNAPTIEQLAGILRGQTAFSRLVPVQPTGTKPPLFMIHSYLIYEGLHKVLGEDQPFYGLREMDRDEDISIQDRAALYVREIRSLNPAGPYHLGGWCAAGPLAVETARQLTEAGERVASVVLFDSWHPGYAAKFAEDQSTNPDMALRAVLNRKYRFHQMNLKKLSTAGRVRYISEAVAAKIRSSRQKLYLTHWAFAQYLFRSFGIPLPHFTHNVSMKTLAAVREFRGEPFSGPITLIRAAEAPYLPKADPACGWNELARGGVDVHFTPGTHESMFLEPNLSTLGKLLTRCLDLTAAASSEVHTSPLSASDSKGAGS